MKIESLPKSLEQECSQIDISQAHPYPHPTGWQVCSRRVSRLGQAQMVWWVECCHGQSLVRYRENQKGGRMTLAGKSNIMEALHLK